MKKIFVLCITSLLILKSTLYAGDGINFAITKDWKSLLARAKKEKKLIFLDAYASWCGPCKYLQHDVFTTSSVGKFYNTTFINAKMDMEKGEGPTLAEKYGVTAYPTLFFINGDGKVVHKYVGALDSEQLLSLGKDAKDPNKQYYTLKEKALMGMLSPEAFHNWATAANKMDDKDADSIVQKYISNGKYSFLEKDMLNISFYDARYLSWEQIKQLIANKDKIIEVMSITENEFNTIINAKTVSTALLESLKDDKLDFNLFKILIAKINPQIAPYETQKMKVKFNFYSKADDKALDELIILIKDSTFHMDVLSMATQITDHLKKIVDAKRQDEFIDAIESFKLLPEEKDKIYFKDFALLALYTQMEGTKKVKEISTRILNYPNVPEYLKEGVRKLTKEE